VVSSPDGRSRENYLRGVSSTGPNDVWAVGIYNTSTGLYLPLTEHRNGQSWQVVPAPSEGSSMTAPATVFAAPKDVWVGGSFYNANAAQLTLAQHWDGTIWQTFPNPSPAAERNGAVRLLAGVVSVPGQGVWAVGLYYQPFTPPQTLIKFYGAESQQ